MDNLYLELNNVRDNIKYTELKIKKCELLLEDITPSKRHFFGFKKYFKDYDTFNKIKDEYDELQVIYNNELKKLETILKSLN